jgi:hypothetical protein
MVGVQPIRVPIRPAGERLLDEPGKVELAQ